MKEKAFNPIITDNINNEKSILAKLSQEFKHQIFEDIEKQFALENSFCNNKYNSIWHWDENSKSSKQEIFFTKLCTFFPGSCWI